MSAHQKGKHPEKSKTEVVDRQGKWEGGGGDGIGRGFLFFFFLSWHFSGTDCAPKLRKTLSWRQPDSSVFHLSCHRSLSQHGHGGSTARPDLQPQLLPAKAESKKLSALLQSA